MTAAESPESALASVLAVSEALCSVAEHLDQCNYGDAAEALLEPAGGLRRLMAQVWDEGVVAGLHERLTVMERTAIENGYNAASTDGPSGPDDPLYLAVERIVAARIAHLEAALAAAEARLRAVEALDEKWRRAMASAPGQTDDRESFSDGYANGLATAITDIRAALTPPQPAP